MDRIQSNITSKGLDEERFLSYTKTNPQLLYRALGMQTNCQKKSLGEQGWLHFKKIRASTSQQVIKKTFSDINPYLFGNIASHPNRERDSIPPRTTGHSSFSIATFDSMFPSEMQKSDYENRAKKLQSLTDNENSPVKRRASFDDSTFGNPKEHFNLTNVFFDFCF